MAAKPNDDRMTAIVRAYGWDPEAIREGLKWVLGKARDGGHSEAAVLIGTLDQLEAAAPAFGLSGELLRRDRKVAAGEIRVRFINKRDWPYTYSHPILALWQDDRDMQRIDDMGSSAVCAVTWNNQTDLLIWAVAWKPDDLRNEKTSQDSLVVSPLVKAALDSLLIRVNRSTGISHPSDRTAAAQLLYLLRDDAGEDIDPAATRAYLLRGGLSARGAADFEEMAEKIRDRRGVKRGPRSVWAPSILNRWRGAAE